MSLLPFGEALAHVVERLLVRRQDVATTLGPLAHGLDIELQCDDRLCVVTRQVQEEQRSFLAR